MRTIDQARTAQARERQQAGIDRLNRVFAVDEEFLAKQRAFFAHRSRRWAERRAT